MSASVLMGVYTFIDQGDHHGFPAAARAARVQTAGHA
jgi:hypothetical protein